MPVPRFEVPLGAVDGVNLVFTTSVPYKPGSTAVFLNGLLQEPSLDDGWAETSPATGVVTLKEAPRSIGDCLDVIQIFFIDTSPSLPEEVVTGICGTLDSVDTVCGILKEQVSLCGEVEMEIVLVAGLELEAPFRGLIESEVELVGLLTECDP